MFDPLKNIGTIITVCGVIFTAIGAWYTMQNRVAVHDLRWEWFDRDYKSDINRRLERLENAG